MRKKIILAILFFTLSFTPIFALAAYSSNICDGAKCAEDKVGPFLAGISTDCGNVGDCSLKDMMIVVANAGNFVLGIVGGIVLLMYVIGGFMILSSGGSSEKVGKGKKMIMGSTVGLLIVVFAYLGVRTLYGVLTNEPNDTYALCDGANDGEACGKYSSCVEGSCYTDTGKVTQKMIDSVVDLFKK